MSTGSRFTMGSLGLPKTPEQQQADANVALAKKMKARMEQEGERAIQKNAIADAKEEPPKASPSDGNWFYKAYRGKNGGRKSRKLGNKFNRCVKAVRSTVRARKGSNKESAAIAICTKSVLHPRGVTMKRYRKKRLVTQKRKLLPKKV